MLRGIAILLVLGAHTFWPYLSAWQAIGASGVPLFFVLSGFLISGLLFSEYQKTGRIDVVRFWIRRGFKIYPAFYLLLALTVLMRCLVPDPRLSLPRASLASLVFLQNYIPHTGLLVPQSWSLAVEEHFYLSLPLLLMLLIRANLVRSVPWLTVAAITLCTYLRMHTPAENWRETHLSMDALLVGVALGYLKHCAPHYYPKRSHPVWLVASAVLLLPVFIACQTRPIGPVATTIQFLGYAALLLWAAPRAASANRATRLVAWIGYYSYSIYLWHLAALVTLVIFGNTFLALSSYFVLAIALGVGMARLVEIPALRLRDRIIPSERRDRVEVSCVANAC